VKGRYNPGTKDVRIGKIDDTMLIIDTAVSTIIHELTHKHMYQNVNQTGVPFKENNSKVQKIFKTATDKLKTENDVLYQSYQEYKESNHMLESIAYFFQKNSHNTYYSEVEYKKLLKEAAKLGKIGLYETVGEVLPYRELDKSGVYQAAVEKYLLPIMHGFDIIFEKLNSIFSGKAKVTGTVLDYLDGDYNVSLLEAMEFITLKLDPRTYPYHN
jgi:hypothetical protein